VASPRAAICAIAKNEGPYLNEWVAYHHIVGFDPILVYDHESTDDSAKVLARLAERGLAERIPWSAPPDKKPQWLAYEDGLRRLRGQADWVAFIDLDEFLVLPRHATVQDFLAEHGELEAIAVNWLMFGSAGHERHEPGLVIERFTRCAERKFSGNKSIKTLARVDAIVTPRVHTCEFREGVRYRTVAGEEIPPGEGRSRQVSHDVVRINHYFTRSREEWDRKVARGRGAKPVHHPRKHRTAPEFDRNDRNEREDRVILERAPAVRALVRRL
jgi:glycosyltransferase involved in cell wall biosynthesis